MTPPSTIVRGVRTRSAVTPALTIAQLRELERELRSEQARLERSTAVREGPTDATSPWSVLRAPTDAEGGLAVALESRSLARYETLTGALRRLAEGTYGRCASCGNPIPYGRLAVMPEAMHCVAC